MLKVSTLTTIFLVGFSLSFTSVCLAGDPPPNVRSKNKTKTKTQTEKSKTGTKAQKKAIKSKSAAPKMITSKCKGYLYKTCVDNKGCGQGYQCKKTDSCVPSLCVCNPKTGQPGFCSQDCHKRGVCVKKGAETPTIPEPKLARKLKFDYNFQCVGKLKGNMEYLIQVSKKRVALTIMSTQGEQIVAHYVKPDWVWDGHKSGLVTAKGMAVKFESHFGCIKNVHISANFRFKRRSRVMSVQPSQCVARRPCN